MKQTSSTHQADIMQTYSVADSRGGLGAAVPFFPINRMHLKTSKNFARKCIIFAYNFQKFFPSQGPPLPFCRPLFQISGSTTEHIQYTRARRVL